MNLTHSAPVIDERALIAKAANGDRTAARELYDAHVERVHRIAYRICGDADQAEDLTQDVFVQVFRKLDTFRWESSFGTWLHRVALTVSLNAMRKVKRIRTRETALEEGFHAEHESGEIEPELRDKLQVAIDALPEGSRVALVMHTIEGYSHKEIGEMLGIAEGTSKARVFDARARLKKMLGSYLQDREGVE